jgi:hypothetical protein
MEKIPYEVLLSCISVLLLDYEWAKLLSVGKKFLELRKRGIKLRLNKFYSREFMQSCYFHSSFKDRVLSAVAKSTEQLTIFHSCSLMGTVKKELQTVCCFLYEIEVSGFNGEIDCEPLKSVKKVTLRAFAWISNLCSLSSLQEITFIECHDLQDISSLKNVPSLSFRSCARLTLLSLMYHISLMYSL